MVSALAGRLLRFLVQGSNRPQEPIVLVLGRTLPVRRGPLVLCADSCLDLAGGPLWWQIHCGQHRRSVRFTQHKSKSEIPAFYTVADLEDRRMIPGRRPLESTTPGDKLCCA